MAVYFTWFFSSHLVQLTFFVLLLRLILILKLSILTLIFILRFNEFIQLSFKTLNLRFQKLILFRKFYYLSNHIIIIDISFYLTMSMRSKWAFRSFYKHERTVSTFYYLTNFKYRRILEKTIRTIKKIIQQLIKNTLFK